MTKKEQKEKDKQESIKYLKRNIKPGGELLVNIISVSKSGMSRRMRVLNNKFIDLSYDVAKVIEWNHSDKGILVSGCGMDMCFHLIQTLSYYLYGNKNKNFKGNGGTCIKWTVTS